MFTPLAKDGCNAMFKDHKHNYMSAKKPLSDYIEEGLQVNGYTRERLCEEFNLSEIALEQFLDNSALFTREETAKLFFLLGACLGASVKLMLIMLGFDPDELAMEESDQADLSTAPGDESVEVQIIQGVEVANPREEYRRMIEEPTDSEEE